MTVRRADVIIGDVQVLELVLTTEFMSRSANAIQERGRFVMALPGGSVASTFLPALARLAIDWARVDVFWIDERAVPPDDPDSNFALASRLLLEPAGVPQSRVHRMRGELADLEDAAQHSIDELTMVAGNPPHLDVALVGVGEDGHIASIFDGGASGIGSAGLRPCPPIIAIYNSPKPPPRRLTMTLPVLASAARVIVAAFGPAKAAVMNDALHRDEAATPIAELLRRAPSSIVLLDRPYSN